jgi:hypothetical protein
MKISGGNVCSFGKYFVTLHTQSEYKAENENKTLSLMVVSLVGVFGAHLLS